MSAFEQTRFAVRCEWGEGGLRALAAKADIVVIVDVLSFSTSVDVAVSRGAVVLPYQFKDESAAGYADACRALLANPNRHASGPTLSPASLIDIPPGTRLVLPSPNGSSLAFHAASPETAVVIGCLRNCRAVAAWANAAGRSVAVIPAGERWPDGTLRPAVEDLLGAGAIMHYLKGTRSPEAEFAARSFETLRPDLRRVLRDSLSGMELAERGFERDVDLAAELDVSTVVPVLADKEIIAATAPPPHD